MTAVAEPPGQESTSRRQACGWLLAALALVVLAAGATWWFWSGGQVTQQELAAKAELAELGALVVMDAERKHVNSVNLSTLKSADALDRALALLPALSRLKSLNVNATQFNDAHAPLIGKLATLQDLVLNNTAITDKALPQLAGLSGLNTLYLVNTPVTSAGMAELGRLRALKILDFSGTKVTGNFEPLQSLTDLNWLLLQSLTLDGQALPALSQCKSLARLTLGDATYPEEALNQLLKDKPSLAVDR